MPEKLSRDMKELLETFNASQVQYLVIGAHALGVYAEPRATQDRRGRLGLDITAPSLAPWLLPA
jgi:hypothetical protein